jgi:benzoyl-CoA reductase/2-hydroxyglutaryl-CoA dehydratase subunit BcrC/BadD/HgdB
MTSFLCETSRALLERAIEGGFNFADCLIAADGCTMMNRAAENMELLHTMDEGKDKFFYQFMEIPMKATENGVQLLKLQVTNHILKPLHENYGIDISEEAMLKAVEEHNEVCRLIRELGEFRKEDDPRITGYEFAVFTLATYLAPKYLIIDKLRETLEEVKTREPDGKKWRARVMVVGSEVDDVGTLLQSIIDRVDTLTGYLTLCIGSMLIQTQQNMSRLDETIGAYTLNCSIIDAMCLRHHVGIGNECRHYLLVTVLRELLLERG